MNFASMQEEWLYFTGALVTIFFIVDPFALIPVYMSLTERFSASDRRVIQTKAILIATGILIVFAVSGSKFFDLFGITMPAFQIAGGLLLLILGVSQLNQNQHKVSKEESVESLHRDDISVFPLATPLLAGPGAISTVVLYSTKTGNLLRLGELLVAIVLCMALSWIMLETARRLYKIMGRTGLNLMSRVMGIVLTAVAVQFVLNGIRDALPLLRG